MSELLTQLERVEVELQQRDTRRNPEKVAALLHESFVEFGRSGKTYDRKATLELLKSEELDGRVMSQDFALTLLSDDVALLTYKSAVVEDSGRARRHSLRASIWVRTPDGWKLQFHQGTPTDVFALAD